MDEVGNETASEALDAATPGIPSQRAAADAPEEQIAAQSVTAPAPTHSPATTTRRGGRKVWAVGVAALLVGLLAGAGIGFAATRSDPTQSKQYRTLQAAVTSAEDQREATKESFGAAQRAADASLQSANQDLEQRASAVAASESAVASSAAAMSQAQAAINANTISEGTWTVGSDVQPGTYRTRAAVGGTCYWEVDNASGGIVKNDIVTGGFPTVTLSAGQTFVTERCGDWLKQ